MLVNFEGFPDEFFEVIYLLVTFYREVVQNASFTWVEGHPEELFLDQSYFWNGQRDVHVGFKRDGDAVTVWALYGRFKKAVH